MTPDQMKELEGRVTANGPITSLGLLELVNDLWQDLKSSEQAREADRNVLKEIIFSHDAEDSEDMYGAVRFNRAIAAGRRAIALSGGEPTK